MLYQDAGYIYLKFKTISIFPIPLKKLNRKNQLFPLQILQKSFSRFIILGKKNTMQYENQL